MVTRCGFSSRVRPEANLILFSLVVLFPFSTARASGSDALPPDAAALAQMEQRAEAAHPRDQCYLYTEVLQGLTELAGHQVAAGDKADASMTFEQINVVATKVQQTSAANAKRLKNVELLLDRTMRHLADIAHVVSGSQRTVTQATLQHLDSVHKRILALVFAR